MKKGLFIVVEGLSGSGKDTQVWNIARDLSERTNFEQVLVTREPADTEYGRKARAQRREDKKNGIDTMVHAELYAQLYTDDMIEHCTKTLNPNVNNGIHSVCNRFSKYSGNVYQVYQGVPLERMLEMQSDPRIRTPDGVFIFDVPVEVALARIDAYRERSGMEQPEIMQELRPKYLELPEIFPTDPIHIIDGTQSKEKVFQDVKMYLDKLWKQYSEIYRK